MSWYPSHFLVIPLTLALTLSVALLWSRADKQRGLWMGRCLYLLLIASELCKHLVAQKSGVATSPLYYPFHYSTTFYLSLGAYLFGYGKIRHLGACTSYVGGTFLFFSLLFNPYQVVGDTAQVFSSYYHFHAYFYHAGVLLLFFFLVTSGDYRPRKKDTLRYLSFAALWATVTLPMARLTGFNYGGLLHSYLPPLAILQDKLGHGAYLFAYGCLVYLFAFCLISTRRVICHLSKARQRA